MKSATHPPAPPTTPTSSEALLEIANRIAGIDGDASLAPSLITAAHALAKELRASSGAVASGLHDIAEALREVRQ